MSANARKTVLLVILVVLVGAFAYDRFVAKRKQVAMMDDLSEMSDSGDDHTEERINQLFGSSGKLYKEGEGTKWVKYSVLRPTLFQTYDVFVKYKKTKSGFVMVDKRDVSPDSEEGMQQPLGDSGVTNFPVDPNAKGNLVPPPVPELKPTTPENPPGDDSKSDASKPTEDKPADDKSGDDKSGDDKSENSEPAKDSGGTP